METSSAKDVRIDSIVQAALEIPDTAAAVAHVVEEADNDCEKKAALQAVADNMVEAGDLSIEGQQQVLLGANAVRDRHDIVAKKLSDLKSRMNLPHDVLLPREAIRQKKIEKIRTIMGEDVVNRLNIKK